MKKRVGGAVVGWLAFALIAGGMTYGSVVGWGDLAPTTARAADLSAREGSARTGSAAGRRAVFVGGAFRGGK